MEFGDEGPSRDEVKGRVYGVLMNMELVGSRTQERIDVDYPDLAEMVMRLEDEFGVRVSPEDFTKVFEGRSNFPVGHVVDYFAGRNDIV